MSEVVPADVVAAPAVNGPPGLNEILADFRCWYEEAIAAGSDLPAAPPALDLATLLGHFIALRQEINLQTRSVRTQQEQTSEFARDVQQGLEGLERLVRTPRPATPSTEDVLRPLLKSLVDVYDAIAVSGQQIQKVRDAQLPALAGVVPETIPETLPSEPSSTTPVPARTFWQRWFLSPTAEAQMTAQQPASASKRQRLEAAHQAVERIASALDGLVTGYTMSLDRIDRVLQQHGLEAIPTVGEEFDPELMEVVDPVKGSGRPQNEVVEEVRRGYLLNGRVFRYAQVRVARD